jgi:integrase
VYELYINNYIIPKFGHIKATSLTAEDIENAAVEWAGSVSYKQVNNVLARLKAVYKYVRKDIRHNPVDDVEYLKGQVTPDELDEELQEEGVIPDHGDDEPDDPANTLRKIRPDEVYSFQEARKLIDAAEGVDKVFLMTALLCGLRHGELLGLRWSAVDFKTGVLTVNRNLVSLPIQHGGIQLRKPKTKAAYRRLKMGRELLKQLREWKVACPPNKNDLIFVNELGQILSRRANYRTLDQVCTKAGVRRLNMHNLRHTFASQCLIAGVPPLKVKQMMGHTTVSTTLDIYASWANTEESNAEELLESRIFAVPERGRTGSENE